MVRHACQNTRWVVLLLLGLIMAPALAVKPAEQLLPDSTCLYVSFPDMSAFEAAFQKTQLGELTNDPVMKPFADDLARQLRDRFGETDFQLGLKWEDLSGAYGGEACLARVQPGNKKGEHATVLLIDVTGKAEQVEKVRGVVSANLKKRNATKSVISIGNATVTQYQLEKKLGEIKPREVLVTIIDDQLLVTNHRDLATEIIQRAEGGTQSRLSDNKIFSAVMTKVAGASEGIVPHVRWFVDPFQYLEVIRASRGSRKRRQKDFVQILRSQGFDAIRAAGGHVNLATQGHEALHRTFVFAPAVSEDARFAGAARILSFPASEHVPLPAWVPRNLATLLSLNWNVLDGFNHSISLIDEIADSEGFVEGVLDSFKTDKSGPMIDIRAELLAHLDDHIVTFSDFVVPISTKSERLVVAVKVKDEEAVTKALQKLWKEEPQARQVQIGEHIAWEIVPEDVDISDIELPGIPLPGGETEAPVDDSEEIKLPNAAMTVARGPDSDAAPYLMISTDVGLLQDILNEDRPLHDRINSAADFQVVNTMLKKLGAGQESIRFFSRTDEEYRSAYEMIRLGKMPESESLLGRVLNRLLGPKEDDVLRKPEIDGSKMPDYQIVRRYLGPAGLFVKSTKEGWLVTGILVNKQMLLDEEAAAAVQANLSSASGNFSK